jgi:hypothetical protein
MPTSNNASNKPRGRALSGSPAEIDRAATVTREDFDDARRAWRRDAVKLVDIVDAVKDEVAATS